MIPACLPSSLWLTATQSITDMEEKESVPDRWHPGLGNCMYALAPMGTAAWTSCLDLASG